MGWRSLIIKKKPCTQQCEIRRGKAQKRPTAELARALATSFGKAIQAAKPIWRPREDELTGLKEGIKRVRRIGSEYWGEAEMGAE